MKTVTLYLAAVVATASLPAPAQTPPCSPQLVAVLARQDVTLQEWKAHLDELGDQVDDLRMLGDALTGTRRGFEIVTALKGLADKIGAVVDYLRARSAFATADRIAQEFPAEAATWRARGNRHRDAFNSTALREVQELSGLTPEAILEKVVEGTVDAVRTDLERETRRLRDGLRDDYQALSAARRAWRQAHERCLPDLEVVPSPIAGRNRPSSQPTSPPASSQSHPPRTVTSPPAQRGSAPDRVQTPQTTSTATPPATASVSSTRPAQQPLAPRRGMDLGAIDRMAAENRAEPRDAPPPAGRPLSQDAYLSACAGKEKTAACHRVHCLHVGAALGDEAWTARCLRGD
jgi:hypothetical protein